MTALPLREALSRSVALAHQPGGLTFTFEELPLIMSDDGFEVAPVSGEAEIEYSGFYDFEVTEIKLDGYRAKTAAELNASPVGMYVRKALPLDQTRHPQIWFAIKEQLERGTHKSLVESAIQRDLEW